MPRAGFLTAALLLFVCACDSGSGSNGSKSRKDAATSLNIAAPENDPGNLQNGLQNRTQPVSNEVGAMEIRDDPGTAGMSPTQRRAYDLGFRDCTAGRYAPDRFSEAYRIGCAAAHDR